MFVVPVGPSLGKKFYFIDSSSRVYFSSDGYFAWDVTDNPYCTFQTTATLTATVAADQRQVTLGDLLTPDVSWMSKLKFKQLQDDFTYSLWTSDGINMLGLETATQTGAITRAWILGVNRSNPVGLDIVPSQDGVFIGNFFFKPTGGSPIWLAHRVTLQPMGFNSLQLSQLGLPRRSTTMARKVWFDMLLTLSPADEDVFLPEKDGFDAFMPVDEITVAFKNQGQM